MLVKVIVTNRISILPVSVLLALLFVMGSVSGSAQWKRATLPMPFSTGYYLDVYFMPSNPRLGWACSIEGYVVRTTDGGVTWNGSKPGRAFLEYIQFITPNIGYTSGPAGIYRSDDGGATWTDITPMDPNQEQSWGSYFLNQNEGVFLVGGCSTDLQAFYRTTNGGQSWTVSYGNERESGLSDALLYKDGSGYALSSGVVWRTSDYGAHWKKHSNTGIRVWHEELSIRGTTFLIPYSGTDCSGSGDNSGGVLVSHDNAITWKGRSTGMNMFGTWLISETEGWAVGDGPTALYTNDGGRTWVNRNCGLEGNMDDVYFVGDTIGWIAGNGLYKFVPQTLGPGVSIDPPGPIIDLCSADSVLLTASPGFDVYQWSDGVVGQARFAKAEGAYTVTAFDRATCQQFKTTVSLRYYPAETPRISARVTEVCDGDSVRLDYVGTARNIRWSNGDTSASITVNRSGTFTIVATDEFGCTHTSVPVSIVVHPTPRPSISANRRTTICLDESVVLSAPPGYQSYTWSNGEKTKDVTVSVAGTYSVEVVDQFGCVGTSDSIVVIVLDTRNKIEILTSLPDGTFVLPTADVGQVSCRSLEIRNTSVSQTLTIHNPAFVGNVFFSVPQAQLPIEIPPLATAQLQLCSSPIDTGWVSDTLILPDTCSPTVIPVRCEGNPIAFTGTSRCSQPVDVLIFRAGTSHQLTAPFPQPATDHLQLTITPSARVTSALVDRLGARVAAGTLTEHAGSSTISINTSQLQPGLYMVVIEEDGMVVRGLPVVIIR